MIPKFIFYKNDQFWIDNFNESFCIFFRVKRQVKNKISQFVIFTYFITTRGKKGEQDFITPDIVLLIFR